MGPVAQSGGGGSRTRVREWVLRSFYVRRARLGSPSGGPRTADPGLVACCLALGGTTPPEGQPDLSSSQGAPRASSHERRATELGYAARARLSLAIVVFSDVLRGFGNLGTLLRTHQTRRSRIAPGSFDSIIHGAGPGGPPPALTIGGVAEGSGRGPAGARGAAVGCRSHPGGPRLRWRGWHTRGAGVSSAARGAATVARVEPGSSGVADPPRYVRRT